jgi:hypothetical protein
MTVEEGRTKPVRIVDTPVTRSRGSALTPEPRPRLDVCPPFRRRNDTNGKLS